MIYKKSGMIFVGGYPNHSLDVLTVYDSAAKLWDNIDSFNDNNSGKKKAYEIKIATVVYHNVPNRN